MSVESKEDFFGISRVSDAVAVTLAKMRAYACPGMSTRELDDYGRGILEQYGARSAPKVVYGFPGWTCISVNHDFAHGIPSNNVVLKEGDLVNIDVSAELNGFYSDNGGSFILGKDTQHLGPLVEASKNILLKAIGQIKGGLRMAELGRTIETEAKKYRLKVIKNLAGHGVGRSLHEDPVEILCYYNPVNKKRFRKNSVVAIETFISTRAQYCYEKNDGWTLATKDESFVAQHEHTIMVTDGEPVILTQANRIWD